MTNSSRNDLEESVLLSVYKKPLFLNQIFIFFYAFRFLHQTTLTSWQENFIVFCIETTIVLKHFQGRSFKDNFFVCKTWEIQSTLLCFV